MLPVSVITTLDGRAFIVDGEKWTPCPVGTTLEQARTMHRKMFPSAYLSKPKRKFQSQYRSVMMKSTKHKHTTYEVRVWNDGRVECDCLGFHYRHKCRHSDYILNTIRKLKSRR